MEKAMLLTNPDVVITAGGTREPIDDVRYITNISSGGLGHALAKEYASFGGKVLLLSPKITMQKFGDIHGVQHKEFTSAEDLRQQLLSIEGARIVLQAAAVSDYTPVKVIEGKMSSNEEKLTIELERTPKILPELRDHFGNKTKIVGFKLLSGVDESVLITTAVRQIAAARTDLCIANDLKELNSGSRRLHIVGSDGKYNTVSGSTPEVAKQVVQAVSSEYIEELTYRPPLYLRAKKARTILGEDVLYNRRGQDEQLVDSVYAEIRNAMIECLRKSGHPLTFPQIINKIFEGHSLGFGDIGLLPIFFSLEREGIIKSEEARFSSSTPVTFVRDREAESA